MNEDYDPDDEWETKVLYYEGYLTSFSNEEIVIRYGASGRFSDDWKNKNLKVQVTLSK